MYLLALMSKPTSTPLPVVMLLMDYWPLNRFNRRAVFEKIPFFVVGSLSAIITYISQSRTAGAGLPTEYGPGRIPLLICHNIVFYLHKIIWPVNLSSHYPYPAVFSLSDPRLMAGIIGSCALIFLLIISRRWTRAALTGWLIFFIALLPTMQIIGFSDVIAADKFAYLPSVGLLMALAALTVWLCSVKKTSRIAVLIVILILSGAEAAGTRKYLVHWRSTMSLANYFWQRSPDSASTNLMMGYAFQKEGNLNEAANYYTRAVGIAPSSAYTHNNLALILKSQGKFNEAVDQYSQALQIMPQDADIHYNLGNLLLALGKLDEAISHYYEALKIKPEHAYALNNLANALAEQGKFDEAADRYRQALKIMPSNAEANYNLGTILEMRGNFDEAINLYSRAIQAKPDFVEAYRNLASILESQGKLDEAITNYQKVIQLKPDDAELYLKAGTLLASQDKLDEAIVNFRQALGLEPNNADVHYNIGMALALTKKPGEAIEHFKHAIQLKPSWYEPALWTAKILAAYPDTKVRDPNNAVLFATQAAELTNYQDPEVLEILAASYAAANQPELAVDIAQQALTLADATQNNDLVSRLRDAIERYKHAALHTKSAVTK